MAQLKDIKQILVGLLQNFLTSGMPVVANLRTRRSLVITNALLFVIALASFVAMVLNQTYFKNPLFVILDTITFIISLVAMIDLRKNHQLERAIILGMSSLFFLFVVFIYANESKDFGLIWTVFFPIFTITLVGHKKGLILTILFYVVILSMAYQGIGVWDSGSWSVRSFVRFTVASAVLTYIVYVYESVLYHASIELEKNQEALRLLSETDPLTGLYNRRSMNEALQKQIDAANVLQTGLSVVMLDIDDFKLINDHFGHNVGDQVLLCIAAILKNIAGKHDYVARWGGEEFLIFLPQTRMQEAVVMAERLRQHIEDAVYPQQLKVTCSFGVAHYHESLDIYGLVNQADKALYQAKTSGKNCVMQAQEASV
jgi:diguanylate cyclase (GGDEF)-like protein